MEGVTGLKQAVLETLERSGRFDGVRLLAEYPGEEGEYPLGRPAVSVGVDGVDLAPGGMGGYYGEQADGAAALYGGTAAITLRFDLFVPRDRPGEGCQGLFETLCDLLVLGGEGGFHFLKTWCGAISFDRTLEAYHMPVRATLRAALTRGDGSIAVSGFVVLRRE